MFCFFFFSFLYAISILFMLIHIILVQFNKIISQNITCYIGFMFCFQTGTLTEDGLDMRGVVPVSQSSDKVELTPMTSAMTLPHDHLLFAMATCHSITIINLEKVSTHVPLISQWCHFFPLFFRTCTTNFYLCHQALIDTT